MSQIRASDLTLPATWSRRQAMSRFPNTDLTMPMSVSVLQQARRSWRNLDARAEIRPKEIFYKAPAGNPEEDPCIDSCSAIMLDGLLKDNGTEGGCLRMYMGKCRQPNLKMWSVPTQQQRQL